MATEIINKNAGVANGAPVETRPAPPTPGVGGLPPAPKPAAPQPKKGFFSRYKREIGMVLGIAICLAIWFMPAQPGLKREGQQCLALSLLAVVWWATGVAHPGFTSLLLLMAWVLTKTAEPAVVFRLWSNPMIFLPVAGFLIAGAVEGSGLGKRIAYGFILRFVKSFKTIIIAAYVLGFLLSIMIPHPWPRSFMIMSVMAVIIKATNLPAKHAANIGLAVFAGSVPTSLILLTGDAMLNVVAMNFGGAQASWLKWLWYMGVPGVVACVLTCMLQIFLFKAPTDFKVNKDEIKTQLTALGNFTRKEKTVMFWVALAVVFWATDSIHKIHPAWVALGCVIAMSLPRIGDIFGPADWAKVNMGTMFFLTAALGIGMVGGATGMNSWVAAQVLPSSIPTNMFVFALLITGVTIAIHAVLGSALAVMGIVTPTVVAYTAAHAAGINPLVPALLVYTATAGHFFLPFHHMNVLVGVGDNAGKYGDAEVWKLGVPLALVITFVTVCVEIPWWHVVGLIK